MPPVLAAVSKSSLYLAGAFGALVVFYLSFEKWQAAVKFAFILALFEGALRKWLLPQGQELVYLAKDVVLAGAYARFFLFSDPEIRRWRIEGGTAGLLVLILIVSFSALNPNIGSIILAIYGLKIYLFYIPVAFMIPVIYREEGSLMRDLNWYVLLAVPICMLGFIQFFAPAGSIWNVYAQQSVDSVAISFGEISSKARITGTFSFITGYATFVIVFVGLVLAVLSGKNVRFRWILMAGVLPMLFANGMMAGSRTAVLGSGAIFAGFVVLSLFHGVGGGAQKIWIWVLVLGFLAVGVQFAFQEASATFMGRVHSSEKISNRLQMPLELYGVAYNQGGALGTGIGMTHPAQARLRQLLNVGRPDVMPVVYDSEPAQVLVELGLFGFMAWYLLRLLVLWAVWRNYLAANQGPLGPVILVAFLVQLLHLTNGSVVLNHTANLFVWGFYGVSMIPAVRPTIIMRRTRPPRSGVSIPDHRGGPRWASPTQLRGPDA